MTHGEYYFVSRWLLPGLISAFILIFFGTQKGRRIKDLSTFMGSGVSFDGPAEYIGSVVRQRHILSQPPEPVGLSDLFFVLVYFLIYSLLGYFTVILAVVRVLFGVYQEFKSFFSTKPTQKGRIHENRSNETFR